MTSLVAVTSVLENSVAVKVQVTDVSENSQVQGRCPKKPPVLNSGMIKRADTHKRSILQ